MLYLCVTNGFDLLCIFAWCTCGVPFIKMMATTSYKVIAAKKRRGQLVGNTQPICAELNDPLYFTTSTMENRKVSRGEDQHSYVKVGSRGTVYSKYEVSKGHPENTQNREGVPFFFTCGLKVYRQMTSPSFLHFVGLDGGCRRAL
jgi:hypothetical protein